MIRKAVAPKVTPSPRGKWIIGVSGGADSVYLLHRSLRLGKRLVIAHMNHGARGRASDRDMEFVERIGRALGIEVAIGRPGSPAGRTASGPGFEKRARDDRKEFLIRARERCGASGILLAHTADDQVETVVMRILEGAGISGLKGIPRRTEDGIERPLLDTWREDIIDHLRRRGVAYRTDRSNADTRFERNWIRHVLLPLLEERYGKTVRKRIFALGERFREIDEFLDAAARRWMRRNVTQGPGAVRASLGIRRAAYAKLPPAVRKKTFQILCLERMGIVPNERLIEAADRIMVSGKPSARISLGKGRSLACNYGDALLRERDPEEAPGPIREGLGELVAREMRGRPTLARLRRLCEGERKAVFDADGIPEPFSVRPLRAGDRIRAFGGVGEKKVKEILIDRKIPRDARWGRAVVCDARGRIVWIPGVVRSSLAPVTADTRRAIVICLSRFRSDMNGCPAAPPVLR